MDVAPAGAVERLEQERRRLLADRDHKRQQIAILKRKLADRASPAPPAEQGTPPGEPPVAAPSAPGHERGVLRRGFKQAFTHELWRNLLATGAPRRAERRSGQDLQEADHARVIGAAMDLRRAGQLRPEAATRAAERLLEIGLADDALEMLQAGRWSAEGRDPHQDLLAGLCWLELGLLDLARETGARAEAAKLGKSDLWALGALRDAVGLHEHVARMRWPAVADLAARLHELGLNDAAAKALATALALGPQIDHEEVGPVLDMALALLRLSTPTSARNLFQAMARLYEIEGRLDEFRQTLAVLRGARLASPTLEPGPRLALTACTAEVLASAGRWQDAAVRFGQVMATAEEPLRRPVWSELARCVGRDVLQRYPLQFRSGGPRKVFDLFPFNGEFDVLHLKLAEMSPWVDHFVIVEGTQTFTGLPKDLFFPIREKEFEAYADKIIYVRVEEFPDYLQTAWAREFFQRDSGIVRGLLGRCAPDDIVIISDCDEILDRSAIDRFKDPIAGAELRTFRYYLNLERDRRPPPPKSTLVKAKLLGANGANYLRLGADLLHRGGRLSNAGWHFSYLGAPADLEFKVRSFSHTERTPRDVQFFELLLEELRGEPPKAFVRRDIDESFPKSVRAQDGRYDRYIL